MDDKLIDLLLTVLIIIARLILIYQFICVYKIISTIATLKDRLIYAVAMIAYAWYIAGNTLPVVDHGLIDTLRISVHISVLYMVLKYMKGKQ